MSRILLVLISFTVLFQSFQRTWIVASWKMNQSYIAAELCEKRFEENSCCAGSCYLDKKLEKNEAEEKSVPSMEKKQTEYICEVFSFLVQQQETTFTSFTFPTLWSYGKPLGHVDCIFHPPTLLG